MSSESPFIHAQAIVETRAVGARTRIWAFAHVLPGAVIGADCNICDGVFVENDVVVGDRVTVKCGVQLWDGITLEDDVFIGPNATFTNDPFPRSRTHPKRFSSTIVKQGASVGANATILPGVTIGRHAMVGAGAVVTRDVPSNAIVVGNPAYIQGYVGSSRLPDVAGGDTPGEGPSPTRVKGVRAYPVPIFKDLRGSLSVIEFGKFLPFEPQRLFVVFDVPSREVRGEHAHLKLHQFLVCLRGECSLVVDDGTSRDEIALVSPGVGIHLPPMIWGLQHRFSRDAVLLVVASAPYEPDDYIREYDEYLRLLNTAG